MNRTTLTTSTVLLAIAWLTLACQVAPADEAQATTSPATSPQNHAATQPATQPTTQPIDPQVAQWLQRLEEQSGKVSTFSASLRWDLANGLTGDRQRRFGKLYFQAGPPARFAVHFDRRLVDQRMDKLDHRWIFDGQWMVEREVSDTTKRFQKWQIVAPDAPAQQSNPLALGAGPFPLPIPFRKEVTLARFEVTLIAPATQPDQEPADSVHLHLVPKPGQRMRASSIDLWYDRQTLMPVRVRSTESEAETQSTIDLSESRLNAPLDPAVIDTSVPKESGWDVQITPWKPR